ncbi:unnamed protein product [Rhizophagus irregularis]|uniref:Uncharacterized protein n=1 Tax=Rhizophagus irregularis TaxID=588596 RepID=A0A916E6L3_9GLOM|nr:unnamed protein product [Rhizophagus irregularis]CAB5358769.1 unnamed protein product [Rhizophagus irregularis]CAB5396324.1 unnamed protein product [Rhizophagus irregularis]
MLYEQQFNDLCEIDCSLLLPSLTFRSTSSGSLSWLDYIWISPSFSIPHLWSSVSDLTDIFSTDHFLITAHFDFLAFREQHHQFKTALLSAGHSHFLKKTIFLMKLKTIPHELQPYIHLSYSLDHFIMSLRKLTSISRLTTSWSRFFNNFEPAFQKLFPNHSGLLNSLSHPLQLPIIFNSSNRILGSIPQIFTEVKAVPFSQQYLGI